MTLQQFRDFCMNLSGTEETYPFDHHMEDKKIIVFKVGSKIYALGDMLNFDAVTLKCDPEKALFLRSCYPSVKAGFHMNKKHWITVTLNGEVSNDELKTWIKDSYLLVVKKLPKSKQQDNLMY